MSDAEAGECEECGQGSFVGFDLSRCEVCGKLVCPDCTNYLAPDAAGPCVECEARESEGR